MRPENMKSSKKIEKNSIRDRTRLPGQNPRQNDAPDHDENNDQNRQNELINQFTENK